MAIPATTTTTTQAVDALLKWKKTQSDSQNPQLLPQDDFIYLILTLKKIPQARINPNKLPLPHPLITPNSFPEICLIIDDRHLTSKAAKQKIKDESICVTKVIKLSKLKTDYKPFESKRKLCDSYEMFFADKRVIPLLPKLLGKQFFRKKKLPLGVDLSHNNWKEQIERGCSSGLLFFRTGTCCVIRVAKVSMERDEIVENVCAAIDGALEFVPKKMLGVRSLHLKFSDSVALPLYQSLPDIKLRIEGVKDGVIEDEGMQVGLKRIHDVPNDVSDEGEEEEVVNGDLGGDELVEEKPKKKSTKAKDDGVSGKKKRKGDVVEVENKKKSNKEKKVVEAKHDLDEPEEDEVEEIENNEPESVQAVKEAKVGKKGVKDKKRKGNVVEDNDLKTKSSDKKPKKKGEKQIGDEKRKGRSVSRGSSKKKVKSSGSLKQTKESIDVSPSSTVRGKRTPRENLKQGSKGVSQRAAYLEMGKSKDRDISLPEVKASTISKADDLDAEEPLSNRQGRNSPDERVEKSKTKEKKVKDAESSSSDTTSSQENEPDSGKKETEDVDMIPHDGSGSDENDESEKREIQSPGSSTEISSKEADEIHKSDSEGNEEHSAESCSADAQTPDRKGSTSDDSEESEFSENEPLGVWKSRVGKSVQRK